MTETASAIPRHELKILSSRVYRGPNVWHYEPAIQLVVDLGITQRNFRGRGQNVRARVSLAPATVIRLTVVAPRAANSARSAAI